MYFWTDVFFVGNKDKFNDFIVMFRFFASLCVSFAAIFKKGFYPNLLNFSYFGIKLFMLFTYLAFSF